MDPTDSTKHGVQDVQRDTRWLAVQIFELDWNSLFSECDCDSLSRTPCAEVDDPFFAAAIPKGDDRCVGPCVIQAKLFAVCFQRWPSPCARRRPRRQRNRRRHWSPRLVAQGMDLVLGSSSAKSSQLGHRRAQPHRRSPKPSLTRHVARAIAIASAVAKRAPLRTSQRRRRRSPPRQLASAPTTTTRATQRSTP